MAALVADAATGWGLEADAEPVITQPEPHPDEFRAAITHGFADTSTDAVVVCFVPPLGVVHEDIPQALQEISATTAKTTAACVLGFHGVVSAEHGRAFPTYPTPEDAVAALAALARHALWRRDPPGTRVDPADIDRSRARELVETLLTTATNAAGVHPASSDVSALLACYGVGPVSTTTSDAPSPTGAPTVNYALHTMEDELFGPVLSLALAGDGGPTSTHGPAHRIPPLTDTDLEDLLDEVGRPVRSERSPAAEAALADVVARISCLADNLPEVAETDLTLSLDADACTVTAATVHLARQTNRTDSGRRSLTS